ncbi:VUT family protein, partial [Staphylococcus capitis]|uniref:VUT family protein n=1 Tax=Staphylococcus capitis TaxID=29388 RepID=UPI00119F1F51
IPLLASILTYIIPQHLHVFIFSIIKNIFTSHKTFIIPPYPTTILTSIIDTPLFLIIAFPTTLPNIPLCQIFITT